MKSELFWLALSVLLAIVQMLVAAQGLFNKVGLAAMVGNREGLPEMTGWAGRAARAHRNMVENLVLFAAVALIAVAWGRNNALTLLGAQLFFFARLAYAVLYVAGIPWLRTLAWLASMVGIGLILGTLLLWKAGPAS
jgi:uncharacterized MAPEG superfamily protein